MHGLTNLKMTKLVVTFGNLANATKNSWHLGYFVTAFTCEEFPNSLRAFTKNLNIDSDAFGCLLSPVPAIRRLPANVLQQSANKDPDGIGSTSWHCTDRKAINRKKKSIALELYT